MLTSGIFVAVLAAALTPIDHQSNTLVTAPGGYRFGDYWLMGLPLEVIIAVAAIPLLLWYWPLRLGAPALKALVLLSGPFMPPRGE